MQRAAWYAIHAANMQVLATHELTLLHKICAVELLYMYPTLISPGKQSALYECFSALAVVLAFNQYCSITCQVQLDHINSIQHVYHFVFSAGVRIFPDHVCKASWFTLRV